MAKFKIWIKIWFQNQNKEKKKFSKCCKYVNNFFKIKWVYLFKIISSSSKTLPLLI